MIPSGPRLLRLLFAALFALAVNGVLFAVSDVLTRERPLRPETTVPLPVTLVQIKPPEVKQEERRREPPKPKPKPRMDFKPELTPPSPMVPALGAVVVDVRPSFTGQSFGGGAIVFDDADLDQAPRAVVRTAPVYPHRARQRNVEGDVTVKLLVRADGSVGEVEILAASPEGYFEDAVRRTVPGWRFEPGHIAGEPVASWVVTTLHFTLDG